MEGTDYTWKYPYSDDEHEEDRYVTHLVEEDRQCFNELSTLCTVNVSSDVLYWIFNRFDRLPPSQPRAGSLVYVRLDADCSLISESLTFISSQAWTLKKLCIDRSKLQDQGPWDNCSPVLMPKLGLLSCVGYPFYERRNTLDDCAALLHFIEAPGLQTLGCGHFLDGHSTQIC